MHLVYNIETTYILINRRTRKERYETERAAKAALTRAVTDSMGTDKEMKIDEYAIAECNDFGQNIEKMRTVKNLMTGVEFEESVNTPGYCSPACESYYTM